MLTREEWLAYKERIGELGMQQLKDKALWEHMSLLAIASEWGVEVP